MSHEDDRLQLAMRAWTARLASPSQSRSLAEAAQTVAKPDDRRTAHAYVALTVSYHAIRRGDWVLATNSLADAIGSFALEDDERGAALCNLVRSRLLLVSDDLDRAREALHESLRDRALLQPNELVEVLLALAGVHRSVGDLGRALVHVAEAAEALPPDDRMLGDLFSTQAALLLIRAKRYHGALAEYSRISAARESPYLRPFRLGNQIACHLLLEKFDAAADSATELLSDDALLEVLAEDSYPPVMAAIAMVNVRNLEAANSALEIGEAVAARSTLSRRSQAQVAVAAGTVALARGDHERALLCLEPVVTTRPRGLPSVIVTSAYDALVRCCRELHDRQRAEMYFAQSVLYQSERRFGPVLEAIFDEMASSGDPAAASEA